MCAENTNTTHNRVWKVTFEFQAIPPELKDAKHDRIMRMFVEALTRRGGSSADLGTCGSHAEG